MQAIQIMSALAQQTRLQVFAELARAAPNGLSAGAIAERTSTPANTMSAHLAILSRAGLVTSTRKGRSVVYRVVDEVVRSLITFLVAECCDGNPDRCKEIINGLRLDLDSMMPAAS